MCSRWSEVDLTTLINLYKKYDFLWKSDHYLYKNVMARGYAYKAMLVKMQEKWLTISDIKAKIKNLRSAYYQELKRISKAEEEGLEYTPKFSWYDDFKEIMEYVQSHAKNKDKSEQRSDSEESCDIEETDQDTNVVDSFVVSIKQEYLDDLEKGEKTEISAECFEPALKKHKGFKNKSKDINTIPSTSSSKKKTQNDKYQIFANAMAEQLRRLPLDKALSLQVEVQSLIARVRIEYYKEMCNEKSGSE